MNKLYTEEQYKMYSDMMGKCANEDDIIESFCIIEDIKEWLNENGITEDVENAMNKRLEEEADLDMKNKED